MDGLGSKEMAFDKFMIWLVAYVLVHTKHSLLSKGIYEVRNLYYAPTHRNKFSAVPETF